MSKRPPSNLNPDAEPWGRWASDSVEFTAEGLASVRSDAENASRINNSTLDSLATQIREVDSRPSNRWEWPSVQATLTNNSLDVPIAPANIPPPDDVARWGWINFNVYLTQSVLADTAADVAIILDGTTIAATSVIIPPASSWPSQWGNWITVNALSAFNASPTAPNQVSTTVFLRGSGATSRTVTIARWGTVQYAQPYISA